MSFFGLYTAFFFTFAAFFSLMFLGQPAASRHYLSGMITFLDREKVSPPLLKGESKIDREKCHFYFDTKELNSAVP